MAQARAMRPAQPQPAPQESALPSSAAGLSSKQRKNRAKKMKRRAAQAANASGEGDEAFDDEDDPDDMPPLEESNPISATLAQTQSDLLATANDLYRQIESAAAAALAGHLPSAPNGTGNQLPNLPARAPGDENDDAYWLSLPAHLRSFIRSALPLAAGLTPPQGGGTTPSAQAQAALNLTPEQMHQAAQQLAQVVQSAGWAGLAGDPNQAGQRSATTNANAAATTIPLGSFTLPLPLHPHPNTTEPGYEASSQLDDEGDESGDDAGDADGSSGKRKKKKKPKKSAVQEPLPPPPAAPLPRPAAATARPAQMQPVMRSAVPAKPGLVDANAMSNGRPAAAAAASTTAFKAVVPLPSAAPVAGGSTPSPAQRASNSEREKIRDFWLALSEQDRRNLVKIEKEAVLRKMKEQQRHGCTCAVCGRKRNAIEEELEVLYEAYYDELEQYALQQRRYQSSGGAIPPPPGPGPFPGSVDLNQVQAAVDRAAPTAPAKPLLKTTRDHKNPRPASQTHTHTASCPHHHHHHHRPATTTTTPAVTADRGKGAAAPAPAEEAYESGESEEEYDEEEDEEEYDDDEEYDEEDEAPPEPKKAPVAAKPAVAPAQAAVKRAPPQASDGFLGFGGSLTVKAPGILTVADDLLKNDGQKFLEMMESLADKRIQREREVQEMYVDEDDEEDGSFDGESDEEGSEEDDEDDDDEEDEEEILTEEQRMEEGRRMFQIFAARMFEQRVLQAYREKIAKERQEQLLRELEMEDQVAADKEAKKAKDAQKKKDKKKAQREKAEADRLKEQQQRDAEEAAAKASAIAKAEEERKRIDAQRVQREEQRRQKEADAMRREEEKRKRLDDEARKRKEKEEKVKAERDARLAREREERERKAREEAERKAKADAERRERDAAIRAAREKEDAEKREREAAEKAAAAAAKAAAEAHAKAQAAQRHASMPSPPEAKGLLPRSPSATRGMMPSVSSPPGLPSGSNMPPMQKPVALPPGIQRPPSGKPMVNPPLPSPMGMPGMAPLMPGMQQISPSTSMQQQPRGGPPQPSPSAALGNRMMPPMQSTAGPSMPQYGRMGPSQMPMMNQNGPSRAMGQPAPPPINTPGYGIGQGVPPAKSPMYAGQPSSAASAGPSSQLQTPVSGPSSATSPSGQRSALPPRAGYGGAAGPSQPSPVTSVNGITHPKTPGSASAITPITASALGALNQGSMAVPRKASVEHGAIGPPPGHIRRSSAQEKPMPIGRPGRAVNGSATAEEDTSAPSSSNVSLREASPPPVLGSSALNEDLDDLEPSASTSSSTYNEPAYSSTTWGSGIWGMPSLNGWSAPAPEPVASPVDRASVLRDRTRLACQSLTHALGRPVHSFSDVFKVMVDNFPDTASVESNEILNSCAQPGNAFNGGGRFQFDQSGDAILLRFDQSIGLTA